MWESYENFVSAVLEGNTSIDARAVNYNTEQLEYIKVQLLF